MASCTTIIQVVGAGLVIVIDGFVVACAIVVVVVVVGK